MKWVLNRIWPTNFSSMVSNLSLNKQVNICRVDFILGPVNFTLFPFDERYLDYGTEALIWIREM